MSNDALIARQYEIATGAATRMLDSAELKRQRIFAGLSQEALGEKAGVTQAHISRLEAGDRDATRETLASLAKALRCKAVDLLAQPGSNGNGAS